MLCLYQSGNCFLSLFDFDLMQIKQPIKINHVVSKFNQELIIYKSAKKSVSYQKQSRNRIQVLYPHADFHLFTLAQNHIF